jgi:hypothetical protein
MSRHILSGGPRSFRRSFHAGSCRHHRTTRRRRFLRRSKPATKARRCARSGRQGAPAVHFGEFFEKTQDFSKASIDAARGARRAMQARRRPARPQEKRFKLEWLRTAYFASTVQFPIRAQRPATAESGAMPGRSGGLPKVAAPSVNYLLYELYRGSAGLGDPESSIRRNPAGGAAKALPAAGDAATRSAEHAPL